MASTPNKRPKSSHRNPNPNPSSFSLLKEPSSAFFPSKDDLIRLLGVVAIAVTVAGVCNYIANILTRTPKRFCDTGLAFEDSLSDICEPCPNYGECFEGKLQCLPGYRKHGSSCIEDGEVNETAKKFSELVEHHVCEAYVQFLCEQIGTIWIQEVEMWKQLDEDMLMAKFGLKNDSYTYAKQKAMETVERALETHTNIQGIRELKCPNWLVENYKPLTCSIRLWIFENTMYLLPASVLLAVLTTLCMSIIRRVCRSRYLSTRAEQLYQQVCEILEENAMMGKSVNGVSEPWVVASRLRDHLLLPKERKDPFLWKKVEELVEEDSRLDQYPKLVKGESKVVWEWQGREKEESVKTKHELSDGGLVARCWIIQLRKKMKKHGCSMVNRRKNTTFPFPHVIPSTLFILLSRSYKFLPPFHGSFNACISLCYLFPTVTHPLPETKISQPMLTSTQWEEHEMVI